MSLQPISFREACAFIAQHHRHHAPSAGWKFGVAVNDGQGVVGVAMIGQPVARLLDDGFTLEVTRCCTDGTKNAASMLYGAAWRAAKALGYRRLVTYTLADTEPGTSLRAAGWTAVHRTAGGTWNRPNTGRLRVDLHPTQPKIRWQVSE